MWCSICRQDVPGAIVPGGGQYCCPRCGETMSSSGGAPVKTPPAETDEACSPPSNGFPESEYDEWEMEERLRHLDRIYARSPLRSPLTTSGPKHFRVDSQHASVPRAQRVVSSAQAANSNWSARLGLLALAFGLAITVCGGCLMGWSYYLARPDLMPIGIPIAVVGQIFLLVGLVLQFDSTGSQARSATEPQANRPALPTKNANLRLDDGPDSTPELNDLAMRLEELSRRLDQRDDRSQQ